MKDSETESHKRDSNKKRNDKLGEQQFWLLEFLDFFLVILGNLSFLISIIFQFPFHFLDIEFSRIFDEA
jgi:hypothetical protein